MGIDCLSGFQAENVNAMNAAPFPLVPPMPGKGSVSQEVLRKHLLTAWTRACESRRMPFWVVLRPDCPLYLSRE